MIPLRFPAALLGLVVFQLAALAPGAKPGKEAEGAPEEALARATASVTADELARLKTLKSGHPRLYLSAQRVQQLKALVASDPLAQGIRQKLVSDAEKILKEPVCEYKLVGPRLLQVSRKALDRIQTLGIVYLLGGERRFADRAIQEMMAVCAFPDWHPAHFLDTAEMTNAVASGYDWLYPEMTPQQRATAKDRILRFGLAPAMTLYEKKAGWTKSRFNWNQVCNGGIAVGALAIADEAPQAAAYVVARSMESIPLALQSFDPDGGWAEGPGYWNYATRYTAFYFLALRTALGTDFGLSDRPGLSRTGWFRLQMTGPLGKTFNYADGKPSAGNAWQMFWLAERYGEPFFAAYERNTIGKGADPMHMVCYQSEPPMTPPASLDARFESVQAVFFRSAWNDPNALYVAMKGGDNQAGHSHLDLGTFVLDAAGQRWAEELGPDDYNLPGYFGKSRWTYYRLKTEGQNTLLINGANQNQKAKAQIVAFRSTPERALGVADLSEGYEAEAAKVLRAVAMLDRRRIVMVDEITPRDDKAAAVEWAMHTQAKVALSGASAELALDGSRLRATILEPSGAAFAVREVQIPQPETPAKDLRKLTVAFKAQGAPARLAILFEPVPEEAAPPPKPPAETSLTLAEWLAWAGGG